MSDAQLKYNSDKERALSQMSLQNYHQSLIDSNKFMLNSDGSKTDSGNLMSGLHSNLFALNSISNQYTKGIDLASLHESFNRAQTTIEESQNLRVKNVFSMANSDSIAKHVVDTQNASKAHSINNNDRNNNKSSITKEKIEQPAPHFKDYEHQGDKATQSGHSNSKSGVSLKCAYCEAREDFKSR